MDWRPLLSGLQHASAAARTRRAKSPNADALERIERSVSLIDHRFDSALDLAAIAKAASLSPYHFHRLFKRELGETPQTYLTRRRIERARELLLRTELSVTEVCLDVGFSSLGSFSTLFRRHTGHAPGRYRRVVVQSLGATKPSPLLAPIPGCFLRAFAFNSARSEKNSDPASR